MKFSDEQIKELLDAARPDVVAGLKQELTKSIEWEAKNSASRVITETVNAFMVEEIVPEIKRRLTEDKEAIIATALVGAPQMAEALAASMLATMKTNLESSWKRGEIFKKLFD